MTLTSDQIGGIELLVDRLKKWQTGDMPRAIKDYSRYIQLIRLVEPQTNIVLMDLSGVMPEAVRVIHVKLQELLRKASQVDILKQEDTDEARLEDSNLMRFAGDFVLMLMCIAKGADRDTLTLNDIEQDIIEALGDKTLTGEKIAKDTGHPYSFKFKSSLSGLRKRGILDNKKPGYFLEPEYEFLLKK
jgi:hypothetical protein